MSSERGAFRGGRGRGDRGGRGGGGGGRGGHGAQGGAGGEKTERPKKENILDLSKYMDKEITVKFSGGREGEPCFAWNQALGRPRAAESAHLVQCC